MTTKEFDQFLLGALEARLRDCPGVTVKKGCYNKADPTAFETLEARFWMESGVEESPAPKVGDPCEMCEAGDYVRPSIPEVPPSMGEGLPYVVCGNCGWTPDVGPPPPGDYRITWHDCTWGVRITVMANPDADYPVRHEIGSGYFDQMEGRWSHSEFSLGTNVTAFRKVLKQVVLSANHGRIPTTVESLPYEA